MLKWSRTSLALLALLAVITPAPAQHVARVQFEANASLQTSSLPKLPSSQSASLHIGSQAGLLQKLQQSGADSGLHPRLTNHLAPHQSAKLLQVQSGMHANLSLANNLLLSIRQPAIPAHLIPGGSVARLTPVTQQSLQATHDLYSSITHETLPARAPESLSNSDLRRGIALDNGWTFRVMGASRFVLFDSRTGKGFLTWGDPHVSGYNANANQHGAHYSDWVSDRALYVLPVDGEQRTIVLVRSTGGDAANAFGEPTSLVIISDTSAIMVEGLNKDATTGVKSYDPYFSFQAHAGEIAAASRLFWCATTGELRAESGERTAPPATARNYAVQRPTSAADTLHKGQFKLLPPDFKEGLLTTADVTARTLATQAVSAKRNPNAAVKARGEAFLAEMKPVAQQRVRHAEIYLEAVGRIEAIQKKIRTALQGLQDPSLALAEVERLQRELGAAHQELQAEQRRLQEAEQRFQQGK